MSFDSDSLDSNEGVDSDELIPIGLYPSCSAVYESLADANENTETDVLCWETQEGEWGQLLTLIFFIFLIELGVDLITYAAITTQLSKLRGINLAIQSNQNQSSLEWNGAPIPVWRNDLNHRNMKNIPILIIASILFINLVLYLAIKVFIVSHPTAHYINTTNDLFEDLPFSSFFNTRGMI